jgi:hypothetical protein
MSCEENLHLLVLILILFHGLPRLKAIRSGNYDAASTSSSLYGSKGHP